MITIMLVTTMITRMMRIVVTQSEDSGAELNNQFTFDNEVYASMVVRLE